MDNCIENSRYDIRYRLNQMSYLAFILFIFSIFLSGCNSSQKQIDARLYPPISFEANDSLLSGICYYEKLGIQMQFPQSWSDLQPKEKQVITDSLNSGNLFNIIDLKQSVNKQNLAFIAQLTGNNKASVAELKDSLLAMQESRSDTLLAKGKFCHNDIYIDQLITRKNDLIYILLIGERIKASPIFVTCYVTSIREYQQMIKSIEASIASIKIKKGR